MLHLAVCVEFQELRGFCHLQFVECFPHIFMVFRNARVEVTILVFVVFFDLDSQVQTNTGTVSVFGPSASCVKNVDNHRIIRVWIDIPVVVVVLGLSYRPCISKVPTIKRMSVLLQTKVSHA